MTDLRIVKTKKLVFDAMQNLMSHRKFVQITVNEICREALISRATFYVHFEDKYDLLKVWLKITLTDIYNKIKSETTAMREAFVNEYVYENKKIIENLLLGADYEALDILFDVLGSFSKVSKVTGNELEYRYVVTSNIYLGGFIYYLTWQVRNKFPKEVAVVNDCLYDIMGNII